MRVRDYHLKVSVISTSLILAFAGMAIPQETNTASEDLELGAIVVRAEYIPDEKRETAQIMSMISSEDFDLRGDSDVASALRRVTGVSIADGRFVYVRGLNERYNNATLNGSVLPSPEPLRKVAPLDLFPSDIVETTIVQKTWSPVFSAEFGGGLIDIRTQNVPYQDFFKVSVTSSLSSGSNLADDGLSYSGGKLDWLGFDDGTRDLPSTLNTAFETGTKQNNGVYQNLSNIQRNEISRELVDDSNLLIVKQEKIGINSGFDGKFGKRIDQSDSMSIGLLGVFSYSNKWSTKKGIQGIGEATGGVGNFETVTRALSRFDRQSTTNSIDLNGFASLGLDILDDHRINILSFITRSTDKVTEISFGFTNDDENIRREKLEWIERQLWTTQINGEHIISKETQADLRWRGSWSFAKRDAPFQVSNRYQPTISDDETFVLRRGSGIEFSEIDDESFDFGVDLKVPLTIAEVFIDLRGGAATTRKLRQSFSNFLVAPNLNSLGISNTRVDFAYRQVFAVTSAFFQSTRSTQSPSYYEATQDVNALYIEADAELTPFMRIMFGIREENFDQSIETRSNKADHGIITPPIQESRILPSTTFTWNFKENLALRLGYSETVNRPQFREVGPSRFTNTETNEAFTGNPFLKESSISNLDARLEWYFSRNQFATLGVFSKNLDDPIEAFNVGSGESRLVTFVNIESAKVQGIEFEFRRELQLSDWFKWKFLDNKAFSVDSNLTLSNSSIMSGAPVNLLSQSAATKFVQQLSRLDKTSRFTLEDLRNEGALVTRTADFIDGRQLQGHSKYLFNLQFGYYDEVNDADLNFLINFQSKRIRSVESLNDNTPAVWEEPPITFDIVYKQRIALFDRQWSFSLKVQNLFDSDYQAYQETVGAKVLVDTYSPRQYFGLSVSHTF